MSVFFKYTNHLLFIQLKTKRNIEVLKLVLYTLLISSILSCTTIHKEDINKYYALTKKAEEQIIDGNYQNSLNYYEKSLYFIKIPLGIDCYNALLASVYQKKWDKAIFWAEKLAKKGVALNFFKQKIFNDFTKTKQWQNFSKRFSNYRNSFFKTKNEVLINELKDLLKKDQKTYCKIPSNKLKLKNAFEKTYSIDKQLAKLIKKYGFPSEEKVGLHIIKDTVLLVNPFYSVLIRHSSQSKSNFFQYEAKQAVEKGLFKKDWYEQLTNSDSIGENLILYDNKFYIPSNIVEDSKIDLLIKRNLFLICENKKRFLLVPSFQMIDNFNDEKDKKYFIKMFSKRIVNINCL